MPARNSRHVPAGMDAFDLIDEILEADFKEKDLDIQRGLLLTAYRIYIGMYLVFEA